MKKLLLLLIVLVGGCSFFTTTTYTKSKKLNPSKPHSSCTKSNWAAGVDLVFATGASIGGISLMSSDERGPGSASMVGAGISLASMIYGFHNTQVCRNNTPGKVSGGTDWLIAPVVVLTVGGAALQGAGNNHEQTNRSVSDVNSESCTSDYDCGYGEGCIKDKYSSEGVCAKKVDEHGLPILEGPDPNSIGPNMPDDSDCTMGSCPIGFRCDYSSGECLKH